MGFFDFLFKSRSFLCIACNKHMHINDADFHSGGIGICRTCHSSIRTFPYTPLPVQAKNFKTAIAVYPYDELIRNAIMKFKFDDCPRYSVIFAHYVNNYIENFNKAYDYKLTDIIDLLVPVPLSKQRLAERGYNQSELICNEISEYFSIPKSTRALVKIKNTQRQSLLPHEDRHKNVEKAYYANPDIVSSKRILLIDDILTTGSTADSCAKTLKDAGAENISVLTLSSRPVFMHRSSVYFELFK